MARYRITIRRGKHSGTLTYSGNIQVTTRCWWDPAKKIPAQMYPGCSATKTHTKRLIAVFLPNVPGFTGIFIHQGSGPQHSDGCIIIGPQDMKRIYDDIEKQRGNVTVVVSDT